MSFQAWWLLVSCERGRHLPKPFGSYFAIEGCSDSNLGGNINSVITSLTFIVEKGSW